MNLGKNEYRSVEADPGKGGPCSACTLYNLHVRGEPPAGTFHLINAQYRVKERPGRHVIPKPNEETCEASPPTKPTLLLIRQIDKKLQEPETYKVGTLEER